MADDGLVTLAAFYSAPEAHLAKGLLQEAGIDVFLADESLVQADWLLCQAVGGVKLKVPAAQKEAALLLLNQARQSAVQLTPSGAPGSAGIVRCPRCGSQRVGRKAGRMALVLITWAFLGYPLPMGKRWVCGDCGSEWKSRWAGSPDDDGEEATFRVPLSPELDSAMVPWQMQRAAFAMGLICGIALVLAGGRLTLAMVALGLSLSVGVIALFALFTLRWQRVVLTATELRLEDGDHVTAHKLTRLDAREYGTGPRVVEGSGGVVLLGPLSGRSLVHATVLLRDSDLDRLWLRIRWLRREAQVI